MMKSESLRPKQINVMSYNVRQFDVYEFEKNPKSRYQIYNFLDFESLNIVCFQEFFHDESGIKFETIDTLTQLLQTPYYKEGYTHNLNGLKFGLCTFTKYPIVESGNVIFESNPNNSFIYTDVVIEKDTVRIYNAHLGSIGFGYADYKILGGKGFPKHDYQPAGDQSIIPRLIGGYQSRTIQVERLLNHIAECKYPIILCCDLNDIPNSYNYRRLSSQFTDAFTEAGTGIGSTYIGDFPFLRIDYLFHSDELKLCSFKTYNNHFSDHKAIRGTFELN